MFVYVDVHPAWFYTSGGSAPQAIWRVVDHDINVPLQRGDWIVVCPPLSVVEHRQLFAIEPPDSETCVSQQTLKQIAAVPGDRVYVDHPIVITPLATVEAVSYDGNNKPLPRPANGEYVVAAGTYWVLSLHPRSVDSRYYGPVATANIVHRVKPIWITL